MSWGDRLARLRKLHRTIERQIRALERFISAVEESEDDRVYGPHSSRVVMSTEDNLNDTLDSQELYSWEKGDGND